MNCSRSAAGLATRRSPLARTLPGHLQAAPLRRPYSSDGPQEIAGRALQSAGGCKHIVSHRETTKARLASRATRYSVMLDYWDEPGKTAEAVDAARWMHTGDLATMDAEGYVNIAGRIKDMVIRGGENIYPREVEEYLYAHPGIADVQVIGVPDQKYGEELMAWIVMRPGAEPLTAEQVREFCTGRLAHYKIPRYVHIVDGFPMTVTGKIRKAEMRERAVDLL